MAAHEKIGILGAGTWGTALARMLSNTGKEVTVWSFSCDEADTLATTRKHINLPGVEIPQEIIFTNSLEEACKDKDFILFAVSSVYVRSTAKAAKPYISDGQIIVDVAKGIEPDTLMTLTEVIADELNNDSVHLVALSGPTHAEEVAADLPTTIVAACEDISIAERVQKSFTSSTMRVYTNIDIHGIELCGALKNIVALASGISSGLGYGDNAKAALITRGLSELSMLGGAIGCIPMTFSGLAGMGDMIVTCTSEHSRNFRCGRMIGQGIPVKDAVKKVGMVVEGINAIPAAMELSHKYQVEMPIVSAVNDIVNHDKDPAKASEALFYRSLKPELPKFHGAEEDLISQKVRSTGMKRVITYGTFDLLHYGHINLLRRAKALGDYLIVVLSSDEFNWNEKHKKTYFTYEQRKQLLESIRYVDLVIPEENWQQKRTDMHEYHVDIFVMGDDWEGKFDFLKEEGVEVVYLPRTPEVSSTKIKHDLYDAAGVESESRKSHDEINTDPGK